MNLASLTATDGTAADALEPLSRESNTSPILTDQWNRKRWWIFDCGPEEQWVLIELKVYEAGAERVHVPLLGTTYWSDGGFDARAKASCAIRNELGANSALAAETIAPIEEKVQRFSVEKDAVSQLRLL